MNMWSSSRRIIHSKLLPKPATWNVSGISTQSRCYAANQIEVFPQPKLESTIRGPSYYHNIEKVPLVGLTLGQVVDMTPDRFGDKLAIVDRPQNIRKSFVQYKQDIDQLAAGFLALNFNRGDRIGIWSVNRYEWGLVQFAAAKAGLVLVTINPLYQPRELEYCLQKLQIRAVVALDKFKIFDYYKMFNAVIPEIANSKPGQIKSKKHPYFDTLILIGENELPGAYKFSDVMKLAGSDNFKKLEVLQKKIQFDEPCNIQFTSGTTGFPKATTLSHHNFVNFAINNGNYLQQYDEHGLVCNLAPLFHVAGCACVTACSMAVGFGVVQPSHGFDSGAALKAIEEEKCAGMVGMPTMYIDILNHPDFAKTDVSSLRKLVVGGSPVPPELLRLISSKLSTAKFVVVYGATEMTALMFIQNLDDPVEAKLDNVGKLIGHSEVKVVNTSDEVVPFGTSGEICVRGSQVMIGYWGEEEKTKEAIKDGWYHTGDIGTLSENGTMHIVGRVKDMIIRGGENIFPAEIETFIATHPKVVDAHVFGVNDKRLGEDVCVWIKLKPNESLTEDELKDFCKGQLSQFKIPRYVRFVDDFPKNAVGKVLKYVMREQMEKSQNFLLKGKQREVHVCSVYSGPSTIDNIYPIWSEKLSNFCLRKTHNCKYNLRHGDLKKDYI